MKGNNGRELWQKPIPKPQSMYGTPAMDQNSLYVRTDEAVMAFR
jgi:hypothetical protein